MNWHIEQKARTKWKRVDTRSSQHEAEQIFFRQYFGVGRIVSDDGLITITVPVGEEKEA